MKYRVHGDRLTIKPGKSGHNKGDWNRSEATLVIEADDETHLVNIISKDSCFEPRLVEMIEVRPWSWFVGDE